MPEAFKCHPAKMGVEWDSNSDLSVGAQKDVAFSIFHL